MGSLKGSEGYTWSQDDCLVMLLNVTKCTEFSGLGVSSDFKRLAMPFK